MKYFLNLVFHFNNRKIQNAKNYRTLCVYVTLVLRNFAGRLSTNCLKVVFANLGLLCLLCNFWLVLTDCTIVKLTHGLVDVSTVTVLTVWDSFILFYDKITKTNSRLSVILPELCD
jgi:hypothetical protein